MSVSQHEADLITENRELRERLQGALADLEAARAKNLRAAEQHARLDLRIQQLVAERNRLIAQLDQLRGGR